MDNAQNKILIVEDSITEQQALKRALSHNGYSVVCASTGKEAVDLAELAKPNLVIIDTILPDMDGYEVCKAIRSLQGLKVKILMNTGNIDAVDGAKAREAGADDYCAKTSNFSQLIQIVDNLMIVS